MLFTIMLGAIAIYVLYSAIRGKGRLFQADAIKEKFKDKYVKILRIIYLALGICMLLNTAASALNSILFETRFRFEVAYLDASGVLHDTETLFAQEEMAAIVQATPQPPEEGGPTLDELENAPAPQIASVIVRKDGMEETLPSMTYDLVNGLSTGFMIASLVPLIGVFVAINIMTDKEKRKAAQASARNNTMRMPSGAFEFDDEES